MNSTQGLVKNHGGSSELRDSIRHSIELPRLWLLASVCELDVVARPLERWRALCNVI